MKIAIIGSYNFHLECVPFLLEIFKNDTINIFISKNNDKYKWLDYCKNLYPTINIFLDKFNIKILKTHDKIFKLTSTDKCLNHEKIISILHFKGKTQLNCRSKKMITLTPYINGSNIFYTFPIFKPKTNYSTDKIVTFIGYYLNDNFDADTISFIKINKNYIFNFIIWGSNNYNNLQNINNVIVYNNICTTELVKIINSSKYIMSKKYINYDRFSGQLGLALSFEKPLLVDKKTKDSYNLPGFVFQKNYSEIGNLNNINDKQYITTIKEIQLFKKETLNLY